MTGWTLLGLTLISMGWLFFVFGLALNVSAWRRLRKAAPGARFGGVVLLPGVIGSVTTFFSVGALLVRGWHVPWPWLWILLPFVVDPGCLALALLVLARARRRA